MATASSTGNTIQPTHVLIFLLFAITCPPYVTACGGILTALSGTIRSPGYPGNYSNDIDCVWVISAPLGYRVTVTFHMFDLQNGSCQTTDHVQIQEGGAKDSPSLGFICGSLVPIPRRTFGNVMRFSFSADGDLTAAGFLASYVSEILPNNFILLTDSYHSRIIRLDLGTISNYVIPIDGVFGPFAVDYDPLEDRIYWTDINIKEIRTAFLNGTGSQTVRTLKDNARPYGLAVDPQFRFIFYTDAGYDVIGMISMSTHAHRTVISTGLYEPRAIALDTVNGVMYWTDVGVPPKLERANYDGSGRRVLVSLVLSSPNSIVIDFKNGLLYWVDAGTDNVERCDLDGKSRIKVSQFSGHHFYGLALHAGQLYMTDWGQLQDKTTTSSLLRMNATGGNAVVFGTAPGRLNEIHIYEDGWQKREHTCTVNRAVCRYLCAPTGPEYNYICLCPDGEESCGEPSANIALIAGAAGGGAAFLLIIVIVVVVIVVVVRKRREDRAAMRNLEPVVWHAEAPPSYSHLGYKPPPPYTVNPLDLQEHVYDELHVDNPHRQTPEPPKDYLS